MKSKSDNLQDIIAARSALLEYYSGKASAFGGFFLASIFGLISLLAAIQNLECETASTNSILVGIILTGFSLYAFLAFFVMPKVNTGEYKISFTHFIFYFLTLNLTLLAGFVLFRNHMFTGILLGDILIGISILPVIAFSYVGFFVIQRFNHYSSIGSKIETGFLMPDKDSTLSSVSNLDKKLFWHKDKKEREYKKIILEDYMSTEDKEQKKLPGKLIITNNKGLKIAYWGLISTLIIVTYGMKLL